MESSTCRKSHLEASICRKYVPSNELKRKHNAFNKINLSETIRGSPEVQVEQAFHLLLPILALTAQF